MALVCAAASVAACTHISTTPDRRLTPQKEALPGVSYSLPMLQYDLTVTRTLMTCPTEVVIGGKTVFDTSLAFKIEASGDADYVPGEVYLVDYDTLSSWFKTSTFALERHPNGTLKSLNAAAADQTGEVIKDVTKTGILVSSMGAGGPVLAAGSAATVAQAAKGELKGAPGLSNKALKDLNARTFEMLTERFSPITEPSQAFLETRSDDLARLVAQNLTQQTIVQCRGNALAATAARTRNRDEDKAKTKALVDTNRSITNQTTLANLKALDGAGRKALGALFAQQEGVIIRQAELAEELAEIDKALSLKTTLIWPKSFDSELQRKLELDEKQKLKISGLLFVDTDPKTNAPRKVQVLNAKTFAEGLRGLSEETRLKLIKDYPKELANYLDAFGAVKTQDDPNKNCVGDKADVDKCADDKLLVTLALVRDEPGREDCVGTPTDEQECLRSVNAKDQDKALAAARLRKSGRSARTSQAAPQPAPDEPRITRARNGAADPGLFVRDSARGRLVICQKTACTLESRNLETTVDTTYVPQLGQLRFLPFRNIPFESNALSIVVREDGKLEKVEYKRDKAVAQAMSSTTADVSSQLRAEQKRLEQQAKDDIAYARSERAAARTEAAAIRTESAAILGEPGTVIQARIDLLTKQVALKKLETPETPDEYAAQNEEIERLNKATAVLTARRLRQEAIIAADKLGVATN